ncbi:MAG: ketoacyl-ACP synthase III [Gammaproteobacteria bacterium]|nr:ketoacyl-ACP synthase III [Gammaproteobacteria bacterium]
MSYARIIGTGSALPDRVLTNADLERMVDTNDEWIRTRTGIERRHIVSENETTADLAETAARRALDAAGVRPEELDLIIVGTTTPDYIFPNLGTLVQDRIGANGCAAVSCEAACAGFLYALGIAEKFIRVGESERVLVIGAETLSRFTDYTDRSTCVLFGDGAGAVVLAPDEKHGILRTQLYADGKYRDLLYFPSGVSRGFNDLKSGKDFVKMQGNEVFRVAVREFIRAAKNIFAATGMSPDELDWFVPHQANLRIIEAVAKRVGIPMDKVVVTIQEHGNTSAASVPLALDVAVRDGRIKPGQTLLFEAFGGGFTWGSALLRY